MTERPVARVDLKLGFACNNRCSFCVQGDKRLRHPPRPLERVRLDLEEGRRRGAVGVVLTGGEPTLQPALLDAVRLSRALGYETIQIQSNGRRFCYPDFCRALIAAGANEFSPALHGSRAEIHDGLTRVRGSFAQTVAGIRNLRRLGQAVLVNTVVTEANRRDLPEIARLLVRLGVGQFQFAFVHIVGEAGHHKSWLVPRKSAAAPFVKEGLEIGLRAGVRCMTEAIPYCLLAGLEACAAERIIPRTRVYDAERVTEDYTAFRLEEGKAKRPDCRDCRWDGSCEGPWREYPELFGWDEFVPVRR